MDTPSIAKPSPLRRIRRILATVLLIPVVLAITIWGTLAINYIGAVIGFLRFVPAGLFVLLGLGTITALIGWRWVWQAMLVFLGGFLMLLIGWFCTFPSNDRVWLSDVAVLPFATIEGDLYTVHNIRNFDYRTETDFTPQYYDKTFDVQKLSSVDLVTSYWGSPKIAHVFVSFGFEGGDHLAISIETRKEEGEGYSTIKGFFKQYELYYVVADERDVIRLRTNVRKDPSEDVYLYQLRAPIENGRRVFIDYMNSINRLKDEPEFYNTLTTNCTTSIWMHSEINPNHVPLSWKILLSGYVPDYLYDLGRLDTSVPFEELKKRSHINARAHEAHDAADFSQRIRAVEP